jgi:hypothetical protein
MATSGKAFAISIGIYAIIFTAILLVFSFLRIFRLTRKFYAPRESLSKLKNNSPAIARGHDSFQPEGLLPPPPPLGSSFLGWIPRILRTKEPELLVYAGVDATLYLKFLRLGIEIFALVSLLVLATALPINLTSGYLSTLTSSSNSSSGIAPSQVSPYTYWITPPSPTTSEDTTNNNNKPETVEPPQIYNNSIPDPPPGITWWQYLPDVPPLPDIVTTLGPDYERYDWRYNEDYTIQKYYFTDLDKTTMANVAPESSRLYAHSLLTWVVSGLALWRIWSLCGTALRLRQYYLLTVPPGAETHSILVTDIPGVVYGTIIQRLRGNFLFKLIPQKIKKNAAAKVEALKRSPTQLMRKIPGRSSVVGRVVEVKAYGTSAGVSNNYNNSNQSEIYTASSSRASSSSALASPSPSPEQQEATSLFSQQQHQQRQQTQEASTFSAIDRWDEAVEYLNAGFTVPEFVEEKFRDVHNGDVAAVQVVRDTSALDSLVSVYDKIKDEATSAIDTAVAQYVGGKKVKAVKKTVVGATLGQWGREKYGVKPVKIDAFEFYRYEFMKIFYFSQVYSSRNYL